MSSGVQGDQADEYGWLARDVIWRQSQVRPDSLALQELATGRTLTYAEFETELRRVEAYLRATVKPGARVAILARNCIHHISLYYGAPRAGAAFVPLNWRLSGKELSVLLQDSDCELLVYETEFAAEAEEALRLSPGARTLVIAPGDDALAQALAAVTPVADPAPLDPLAPSMLLYTSGTTGRPKGVIHTQKTAFFSGLNFTHVGEVTAGHAFLCDAPLFHVVALLAIMHSALMTGSRLHIADRFVPADTTRHLVDLKITHYFCVPQMAQSLLQEPAFQAAHLDGLKMFTGGAPMPAHSTLALLAKGVTPSNGFGMSENGTVLGVPLNRDIALAKAGAAGVPTSAIEVRLVGLDGKDVEPGEAGEIWLKGPSVTPGYWNQPEATAKAFSGGWFRTGDAARKDEDGFYFIVDRWKDMYITGGENVYPAEVEAALTEMDGVTDAAVLGVRDPRWGETGVAFIVLKPGASVDTPAVMAWCDSRLARYKRPGHVRFVDEIPRTASGKILKHVLRNTHGAEFETELQT